MKISKIKNRQTDSGKSQKLIQFKHFYTNNNNEDLLFSIPTKNLAKANIRRPITKKKLQQLFKSLSQVSQKDRINPAKAKLWLTENDPFKTAKVLKRLWADKLNESTNFSRTKKDLMETALKRLEEEVAFLEKLPLKKARERIKAKLPKGSKTN